MKLVPFVLFFVIFSNVLFAQQIEVHKNTPLLKNQNSPFSKLKSINITDVTWLDGFWKDRFDQVYKNTIPFLYDVMNNEEQGKSIHNFEIAAGLKKGNYKGNNWQDACVYAWIEMAAVSWALTKNDSLNAKIDSLISIITMAQEYDGYISTSTQLKNEKRFSNPLNHEWYNMGHLLSAAALHHRMTEKNNFLQVAEKVGNYAFYIFSEKNKEGTLSPVNPSLIIGAVELYRETGNSKYLELAKLVTDIHEKSPNKSNSLKTRIPFGEEEKMPGSATWSTYLYAGATDVYLETGDSTLLFALDKLWCNLVENKLYVHGGTSAQFRRCVIRKDGNSWKADEISEPAKLPFQQNFAYSNAETYRQDGNFMWNFRMLNATTEPRFAEILENTMYNGFLTSMGQNGPHFFSGNPLRRNGEEQILFSNTEQEREIPGASDTRICCPGNYAKTLVELLGTFYSKSEKTFWIHQFGASRYNDGEIIIDQRTQFPWENHVEIVIDKIPKKDTLKIRIPEWSETTFFAVNGKRKDGVEAGKYLTVYDFKKGQNRISIVFQMKPRMIAGNPKIEETKNQVAIKRGPLLYALEEIDLPATVEMENVVLPIDIKLEPANRPQLLGGITILEGTAKYFEKQNWENKMYQDLKKPVLNDFRIQLIPYYTWAKRDIGKMTVWLPIGY